MFNFTYSNPSDFGAFKSKDYENNQEKVETQVLQKQAQRHSSSRLKEVLADWSESVDINIYNKIFKYKGNAGAQCFWLAVLLASTAATFWLISNSIIDYLKYEVVSQTNVAYEIPSLFPTITFCENDPFTSPEAQALFDEIALIVNFNFSLINQVIYFENINSVKNDFCVLLFLTKSVNFSL